MRGLAICLLLVVLSVTVGTNGDSDDSEPPLPSAKPGGPKRKETSTGEIRKPAELTPAQWYNTLARIGVYQTKSGQLRIQSGPSKRAPIGIMLDCIYYIASGSWSRMKEFPYQCCRYDFFRLMDPCYEPRPSPSKAPTSNTTTTTTGKPMETMQPAVSSRRPRPTDKPMTSERPETTGPMEPKPGGSTGEPGASKSSTSKPTETPKDRKKKKKRKKKEDKNKKDTNKETHDMMDE